MAGPTGTLRTRGSLVLLCPWTVLTQARGGSGSRSEGRRRQSACDYVINRFLFIPEVVPLASYLLPAFRDLIVDSTAFTLPSESLTHTHPTPPPPFKHISIYPQRDLHTHTSYPSFQFATAAQGRFCVRRLVPPGFSELSTTSAGLSRVFTANKARGRGEGGFIYP